MASTTGRSITGRKCITHLLPSAALLLCWHACSTLQQRKTLRAPHFRGSPPTTCLRPSNWGFHVFAQNADIGSGHRKMRGITRRHAQTLSSFATNATFSGAAARRVRWNPPNGGIHPITPLPSIYRQTQRHPPHQKSIVSDNGLVFSISIDWAVWTRIE